MKIDSIHENPKNPRTISPEAFKALCNSIKTDPEFMLLRPIVIDENNMILGGNQRYEACLALGFKELPDNWVLRAEDLSEEKKKRFVLVDNAPDGMSGEWDFTLLADEWDEQELFEFGLIDFDPIDVSNEWTDLPTGNDGDLTEFKKLTVRFLNKQNYIKFANTIGQLLTDKTKSIWFPAQDFDSNGRGIEFAHEEE